MRGRVGGGEGEKDRTGRKEGANGQEKDGTNRAGNGAKSQFFDVRFDPDLICLIPIYFGVREQPSSFFHRICCYLPSWIAWVPFRPTLEKRLSGVGTPSSFHMI